MNILLINCSPVRNGATAEIIKTVHSFWSVHTRYTISASMIMRFTTVRAAEAATRRQNVYRKMMCKRSLQNLSGRTALSVSPCPTGQMFPVNSNHLSTAAHRGATPMSRTKSSALAKRATPSRCGLVQTCGNATELLKVLNTFMGIWRSRPAEIWGFVP